MSRTAPDQSNTSVLFGTQLVMKMFRRVEPGINPDVEIGRFLTERGFARVPQLAGAIEYEREDDEPASAVMIQQFVWNQGNGWQVTIEELGRYFERVVALPDPQLTREDAYKWIGSDDEPPAPVLEAIRIYLTTAEVLGRRTGELHVHLASAPDDPAFAPETNAAADLAATAERMQELARRQLGLLASSLEALDDRSRAIAGEVLANRDGIVQQFDDLVRLRDGGLRIRTHGDYHLGQVLVNEGDVVILDFEGEPARTLAERRAKYSPLRDVAGMLRSFSYAALTGHGAAAATRLEDRDRLAPWADFWEAWVSATFLRSYRTAVAGAGLLPSDQTESDVLLQAFVLDKALYELGYELNNRPEWVHIPLTGLLRLRSALHA
jgi:maltose alpha-D-glucosyltransferase/alpha-amylase